jgi:tetratricopeptide (TPR) repeat protein
MIHPFKTIFISLILLFLTISAIAQDKPDEYKKTIEMADSYFTKGDYINAKASYQIAIRLAPNEQYPKDRLQQSLDMIKVQMYQNGQYTQKIQVADEYYNKKDFDNALKYYQEALTILPGDVYASGKVQEITRNKSDSQQLDASYQKSITNADKFLKDGKLEQALAEYKNASGFKPSESYPKEKALVIDSLISEKKHINDEYQSALRDADLAVSRNKYDEAIQLLQKAITLMPDDPLPKQKLAETQNLKTSWDSYNSIIAAADDLYMNKDFQQAKEKYLQAKAIKPTDEYPQRMLEKIDIALLSVEESNRSSYEFSIEKADALFNQQDYEKAMVEYQKALTFKPDADYAKQRINDINNALNLRKSQEEAYSQSISRADKLYQDEKYEDARTEYQNAIVIKPLEQYPKVKVDELNLKIADLATKRERYNDLVKGADKLFFGDDYAQAREQYREANYLFPKEQYPLDQITMINEILGVRDKYTKAVTKADQLLYKKDLDSALLAYRNAASINPKESYPSEKIKEIESLQVRSVELTAAADKALIAKDYQKALDSYQAALAIKPNDIQLQAKIEEANKAQTLAATQKSAEEEAARIAADKAAAQKAEAERIAAEQEKARLAAEAETARVAAEKVTAEKAEAARIAAEKAAAEKAEADRIAAEQEKARLAAEAEAARVAAEKVAAEKAEADRIAAEQEKARLAAEAETARVAAEKAAAAQKAAEEEAARVAAEKAAAQKAAEAEAARIEAEKAAAEKAEADRIAAEQEKARLAAETEAARIAAEKAAAEKAEADRIAAEQEKARLAGEAEAARVAAEKAAAEKAEADRVAAEQEKARLAAEAETARVAAEKAAAEKAEADRIAAEQEKARLAAEAEAARVAAEKIAAAKAAEEALNKQYDQAMASANSYFSAGKYEEARTAYQEAGNLKPNEEAPKKQIIEIDHKLQAMEAERDQAYQVAVTKADGFMATKEYEMAKIQYSRALELKPGEAYAQQKLDEANIEISKKRQLVQEEYDKTIIDADKFYNSKTYDNALDSYRAASLLKPDEAYPKEMAGRILKLLSERSIVQINNEALLVANNTTHKFEFSPVPAKDRKSNYIFFKARNTSQKEYKLIISYGKDMSKNGGIVIKVPAGEDIQEYIVRISAQYKWFSEDNNWISFYPEGGDIEVYLMQVSYSD